MPNRRRRKCSTAMRTVAAVAVASPVALVAVTQLSPAPQEREFTQAALVTDLPGELMSALSQGLSQFGINLPPMPTGLLTGSGTTPSLASPSLTSPGLGSPGLTSPGLTSPGLTSPGLTAPGLTDPGLTNPALTSPEGLTSPGLTSPGLTAPGGAPGAATPSLTDPGLTNPSLTNPSLTNPAGAAPGGLTAPGTTPDLGATGLTTPGLTTPSIGGDPSLTQISNTTGLPAPGEVPISAPLGADPSLGTYPILGDPSLGAMPAATGGGGGGGGLFGDLSSAAQQLGAGQAIDLLKGMVMPAITGAMQQGVPAAAPPVPAPAP
ncbi:hypothetical protein M1247_02800 [Mycobacterium sp. 21AC1]|uniref:hypothetical protein n=1 Tax=[Mycobacterium] appelbergii TaxID=2939269 RepID=UPI0029393284|nr:hypothetical protein [Mycobacterium sp. 21AC1]MDV3123836.1 hypothetical protein [Mycobacterium sp. 21AC1]